MAAEHQRGGRKPGARNKKPTRTKYIYVRMTAELYAWVLAHQGKSESDTVVNLLEACRLQHQQPAAQAASKGTRT